MPTPPMSREVMLEAVQAWQDAGRRHGEAAKALGINHNTFKSRLNKAKRLGLHLSTGAQAAVSRAGLNGVEARGGWIHNYDDEGKKTGTTRWAAPDDEGVEGIAERIKGVLSGITAAPAIAAPSHVSENLLTVYPLADAHIGMMAWGKETGEDYDTQIAADRVRSWVARAVDASPASGEAVILGVGDLTHADDQMNMTPRSKHVLDVDTRHFKTLDATIAALAYSIEYAAQKHAKVTVRILPGNHDQNTYLAVMFALCERYRDNPRVNVQKEPGEFWVHRFGDCLLAAHHGHGGKPDRMVMWLADEHAAEWGQTRHRILWTGHLHHHKSADIGGVVWEQLRAITARDAYAAGNAYTARSQLQAITFDKQHGEVMRVKVAG